MDDLNPPPPPLENDSFLNDQGHPPPPPNDEDQHFSGVPNDSGVVPPPPPPILKSQELERRLQESPDYLRSKNLNRWRSSLYLFILVVFVLSVIFMVLTCIDRRMCNPEGVDIEEFASIFLIIIIFLYPFLSFLLFVATNNFLLAFLIFLAVILFFTAIFTLILGIISIIFAVDSWDGSEQWNSLSSISQLHYTDYEGFQNYYKNNMAITGVFLILIAIAFAIMGGFAVVLRVKMGGNEQGARRNFGVVKFVKAERGVIKRGEVAKDKEILGFSLLQFPPNQSN